jgi:uncharacterized protein YbjT (DUF2867 family)
VRTRTQPIAVADVVRYLVGVLELPAAAARAFDIGGPEVLEYGDMLRRVSAIQGRSTLVLPIPLLSLALSWPLSGCWQTWRWVSLALWLLTDVDPKAGRALLGSMNNEVVVREDSIRELVPFEPMDYDHAVLEALGDRVRAERAS